MKHVYSILLIAFIVLSLFATHSVSFLSECDWQRLSTLMSFSLISGIVLLTIRHLQIRIAHIVFLVANIVLSLAYSVDSLWYMFFVCFCFITLINQLSFQSLRAGLLLTGLIECITGILQYMKLSPSENVFTMYGHFNNPAGFAAFLVSLLPFTFGYAQNVNRRMRYLYIIIRLFFVVAILLSNSRAGILSACVIFSFFSYKSIRLSNLHGLVKLFVLMVVLVVVIIGLYFLKQDSADGRLLIWSVSWEMFKNAPITGHGANSFIAQYMEYQAEYLTKCPDYSHALLAADVKVPFNEYIKLLVEFGLLGFIGVGVFIRYLWIEYKRSQSDLKVLASLSIMGISVFAFFSYPFTYLLVILVLLFDVSIICQNSCVLYSIRKEKLRICKLIIMPIMCWIFILLLSECKEEKELYDLAHISVQFDVESRYEKLYARMPRNYVLLYNFGAYLNQQQKYEKSNQILFECLNYFNNSELQLFICDNYIHLKNYTKALQHSKIASAMVPARFYPLYYQFIIAQEMQDTSQSIRIAKQILDKHEKVNNVSIKMLKIQMRRYVQSIE